MSKTKVKNKNTKDVEGLFAYGMKNGADSLKAKMLAKAQAARAKKAKAKAEPIKGALSSK